ncbi:MAG: SprT family zinc-dependent metalloprotease [Xanthomonadales bacterium]|nr:SprT family zinc-dependent metalloprotease [Xanthomonadales bacterium]
MIVRARKMPAIRHGEELIEYRIRHRPTVTRRIHLELGEDGELRVVAPRRMSARSIQRRLQQHALHVARFLERARDRQSELAPLRYLSGERHLYLGKRYPLEVLATSGRRGGVEWDGRTLRIRSPGGRAEAVPDLLARWYRQQAQKEFQRRLQLICRLAEWTSSGTPPLRLRRMKRTWGNCSAKGVITLNPHLIKAPPECVDYVIAHEVCHLREHNHGKNFYALQQDLYPGWREATALLRRHGHVYLHS